MNRNIIKTAAFFIAGFLLGSSSLYAKENIGVTEKIHKGMRTSESCAPSSSSIELDINNVRCLLHNGGDFWWDLVGNPRYEVPKVDNPADQRHSSFAGSLWIGGVDEGGQLRVAGQTYRQTGNDFWPGPLTSGGAIVEKEVCDKWDKHFKIEKSEIDEFRSDYSSFLTSGTPVDFDKYPNVVGWPTVGEDQNGETVALAPFVDVNNDGIYTPGSGDYPDILGDQAIWWVINDKGDVHTETGGEAIGLEIQMLAFAFTTANSVNDMTFYKYKVINKSTLTVKETYMGQWVDPDIGFYSDDYVGCDTVLGLGFAYNGDSQDESATGYGFNPPSLGVDFFQGPLADPNDGVDNDKDGAIDEFEERIGMAKFVYYENDFSLRGNPEVATHFYGYLRGFWKDGSQMVNNGQNGYAPTAGGPLTNYMYPGNGGWCGGDQEGWSEESANNQPFDRRFLQSAGPFTLQPGALNEIITGVVWARGYYNDHKGSVCELLQADEIAQALFDNNFELLAGPDAPALTINEYDQELVLTWGYSEESKTVVNNYRESYAQADPILTSLGVQDSIFEFQGYMVFQLKDNTVSASELFDTDKARLIAQCDIKDDISTIVNRTTSIVPGLPNDPIVTDEVMVQGGNEGLYHSIRLTSDEFAESNDRRLKNYTSYYYAVIAYAHNDTASDGRKFIQGNRFFKNVSAVPHKIEFENYGTVVNSNYGDGIALTQTQGLGNGGNYVTLDDNTFETAVSNGFSEGVGYVGGKSPIQLKVVNPKEVKDSDYRVSIVRKVFSGEKPDTLVLDSITNDIIIDSVFVDWMIEEKVDNSWEALYYSTYSRTYHGNSITVKPTPLSGTERIIEDHGFSISVSNQDYAGDTLNEEVLVSGATIYEDPNNQWLAGFPDIDGINEFNWILSGTSFGDASTDDPDYQEAFRAPNFLKDPNEHFEGLINGTWTAYCMGRKYGNGFDRVGTTITIGSAPKDLQADEIINLNTIPDVDIVFTSDSSLWSRCVVVETSPSKSFGSGSWPMSAKWHVPVDQNGSPEASEVTVNNQGMSWFPGYAVNVNNGQRLNVFFGESTFDKENRGDDMIFNPTSDFGPDRNRAGGRHYVYVSNTPYNGCADIRNQLAVGTADLLGWPASDPSGHIFPPASSPKKLGDAYNDVAWVGVPMLAGGFDFDHPSQMPSKVKLELRSAKRFSDYPSPGDFPVFTFNTGGIAAALQQEAVAKEALLDLIRIVPNPYYAISKYERSQLQTTVKLTNLPQKCTIKIFTLNGTIVRTYQKDSDQPNQDWDLKNSAGVPVASGVYIIHIDAEDLGEKILKFMAIMPEIDLNAF